MTRFDIWAEGYAATGERATAACLRRGIEAESFKAACVQCLASDGNFNVEHLTYWGCRLFASERDARRSFG